MTPEIEAEAAQLVDLETVRLAEAALAEHQQRLADARRIAAEADDAVLVARALLEGLVDRAFTGEVVTPQRVAAAQDEARHAEGYSTFSATLARRHEASVAQAQAALADAKAVAWRPVVARGVEYRIAAAKRADRARLIRGDANTFPAELPRLEALRKAALDAAEPEFRRGSDLIEFAISQGARVDLVLRRDAPEWPSAESRERTHWGLRLTPEELAEAVSHAA